MLKRLDSPFASADQASNLRVAEITEELQHQHLLLVFGELQNRLFKLHPIIDRMDSILPARIDQFNPVVERCQDWIFAPYLANQHIPCDCVEPAKKRLFAAVLKPADPFQDSDKYFLSQVLRRFRLTHPRIQVPQDKIRVSSVDL